MIKIGLELEEFCVDKESSNIILIPKVANIPHDGCGWLIEYRSQPCYDITEAVYSLMAEEHRNISLLEKHNIIGLRVPVAKPAKDVRRAARRRFIKSCETFNNIYGHKCHRNNQSEAVASVHISITSSIKRDNSDINRVWDYCDFIRYMDKAFAEEINGSKRRPGFYELKDDGRFEYRSLPNNISLNKLIDVVSSYDFYN